MHAALNLKDRVLVVEDAIDIQDPLKDLFEAEGYTCLTASNGQEALKMLSKMNELPSVILLDLMMPVMDGYVFRIKQKADPRLALIPVFVMTADGHIESKAIQLGAKGYIKKPITDIDLLLKIIKKHCNRTNIN